ncbi:hypothetical protein [Elizabethkingia anophelis]|uniref:hypothetical protein n=1 Tax=Elizabethkingia anophelis TaxID=1117645 RepID=UPI00063AF711|nr:hypothetical protein [Elizabethkingia anophelis]AKH96254.1 hypothetical protein M876_17015 [Elizabethkingia anophelis FMS-007]
MNENMNAFNHLDYFRYLDDDSSLAEIKRETMLECRILEDNNMISIDYLTGIYNAYSYDFEANESFINTVDINDIIGIYLEGEKSDIIISEFDKEFKAYIQKGQDVEILLNNLKFLLKDLSRREYDNFNKPSYIYRALDKISAHIKKKYGFDCELSFKKNQSHILIEKPLPHSYKWKDSDTTSLKKLYTMLSEEPKIIDCSEETFIKAFSLSEVEDGIKWCVIGKNGQYSKQSLIQFISHLMSHQLILNKETEHLFNKALKYVFRDNKGEQIKNLSISKSNSSHRPTGWGRIENILNNL